MSDQTETSKIVLSMLLENTGIHMMDSGDHYGRNWQRNAKRDIRKEPPFELTINGGIDVSYNLYHFLTTTLTYSPELNSMFRKFASKQKKDLSWLCLMESFADQLYEQGSLEEKPISDNSYNHECLIDQTIQYVYFSVIKNGVVRSGKQLHGGHYVLLQIHGGCDVRGGYTEPKAFMCNNEYSILNYSSAEIACENGHSWQTDDAYHWYNYDEHIANLETYEIVNKSKGVKNKLAFHKESNTLYCPLCNAKLEVR